MMVKKKFKVDGMHCSSCAMVIEGDLEDGGANKAACSYAKQELEVEFDEKKLDEKKIKEIVQKSGYKVVSSS